MLTFPNVSSQSKIIKNKQIFPKLFSLVLLSVLIFVEQIQCIRSFVPHTDKNFRYYGRYYIDTADSSDFEVGTGGIRFGWSCFQIRFCLRGVQSASWTGRDSFGDYMIVIDGGKSVRIRPGRNKQMLIYSNTSSIQQICMSIVKITQDHYGPLGTRTDSKFSGIILQGPNPQLSSPSQTFSYKLQFVGDSLTSAFGVMSGKNPLCFFRMRQIQNCLQSWAAILSKKLNAEYRIIAESGKGVVGNQIGITGPKMPVQYGKITSNSKPDSYYFQDGYEPDAIIYDLGGNDYSNIIVPDKNNFIYSYQKMLTEAVNLQIKRLGRRPKIIGICHAQLPHHVCQYVKQAIQSFKYAYSQAYYIQVPPGSWSKNNAGCIGHPNIQGQHQIANFLYSRILSILQN